MLNHVLCDSLLQHVPTEFAEKYLSGYSGSIKLQDSNAKHWDVRFVCVNPSLQIMCKGCSQFFTDNNLEVGDVCLFEMMKRKGGVVLKVSVLCAAEYSDIIDSRNVKKSTQTRGSQDLSTRQSEDEEMFAFDLFSYTYPEWQLKFPNELEKVTYATRMFKLKNPFFAVILQFNNYHLVSHTYHVILKKFGVEEFLLACFLLHFCSLFLLNLLGNI